MSELNKDYDENMMTWNDHDRAFLSETVDTIYQKIAEVLIAQNDRFFKEQEVMGKKIAVHTKRIDDHEKRLRRLELRAMKRVAIWIGIIIVTLALLSFLIF